MMRGFLRYRLQLPFYRKVLWPLALRFDFIAAWYFCFCDRSFYREFQATLAGKSAYYTRNASGNANVFLLRRNVHRLEKGLIMRPRREVFAMDYIAQTVDCLSTLSHKADAMLWKWSYDVLTEYFRVTSPCPATAGARQAFRQITTPPPPVVDGIRAAEEFVPYQLQKQSDLSLEQFKQLAVDRRSVRWFSNRSVDRNDIERAMQIALLSPSACNRQPFRYLAFDDAPSVEFVANIPPGTTGFAHNIPLVIAIVGQLDAYGLERDRHVMYIDTSLSAMSFMYALETLGLSSCPINWPDNADHDRIMQTRLGLQKYERTVMLLAVGYQAAAGMVPRSAKNTVEQTLEFRSVQPSPSTSQSAASQSASKRCS